MWLRKSELLKIHFASDSFVAAKNVESVIALYFIEAGLRISTKDYLEILKSPIFVKTEIGPAKARISKCITKFCSSLLHASTNTLLDRISNFEDLHLTYDRAKQKMLKFCNFPKVLF